MISNDCALISAMKFVKVHIKGGSTLILLGLMFLIVGILVLTGTYIIYAYVVVDLMNDPLYDASLMSMIIPGVLFVIFLVAIVTVIVKIVREEKWNRLYIVSMAYFVIAMSFLYSQMPEPLKDLISFVFFCFIFATILLFVGFNRMMKRQAKKDSLTYKNGHSCDA